VQYGIYINNPFPRKDAHRFLFVPVTERPSEEYADRVKFCKLNVDENPEMARKYRAMNIPLFLFFKGGKQVDSIVGAAPESMLQPKVKSLSLRKMTR
jgi:thioredoxin 1